MISEVLPFAPGTIRAATKPLQVWRVPPAFAATTHARDAVPADVLAAWLAFLPPSDGPCPVLQAPGSLAVAAALEQATVEVVVVRDARGTIVGIQPIRRGTLSVDFNSRSRHFFKVGFGGVSLIGSEPLVADPADKPAVLRAVLDHLGSARAIELHEAAAAGPLADVVAAFAGRDRTVFAAGFKGQWTHAAVPASIEAYNASLGKKKLYNLRRQDRLLAEHLGSDLELVAVRDEAGVPLAVAAMQAMTGWTPAKLSWANRDAELSARAGIACFFVLKAGDRLVGLVRATAWGGHLHVHSMHRDVDLEKFSPGTAVWQAVLRWLIAGGEFRRIVFAYGTPAHSSRATNLVEARRTVFIFRKSVRASAVIALHRAFEAGKTRIKAYAARRRPVAAAAE